MDVFSPAYDEDLAAGWTREGRIVAFPVFALRVLTSVVAERFCWHRSVQLLRGPLLLAAALQLRLFLLERFSRNAQEHSDSIVKTLPFGIAGHCRRR